jgi:hypothetical protein
MKKIAPYFISYPRWSSQFHRNEGYWTPIFEAFKKISSCQPFSNLIHGKIIKFVSNLTTHLLLPFVHDFGKMKGIQIITYCPRIEEEKESLGTFPNS